LCYIGKRITKISGEVGMPGKRRSTEDDSQSGGISEGGIRAGRDVRAGRDIAGRDIVTQTGQTDLRDVLALWQADMEKTIEAAPELSDDEKTDAKEQVAKISTEAAKGKQADKTRLEKLINTLAIMAPDIFEVAVTTLANPLAGIGLVLKKIGEKARLEAMTA
jgi:hypothetical protein